MRYFKIVLILLFISTSFQIQGQKKWSLIPESELLNKPNKNIVKIQPIVINPMLGGTGFFISETCILTNRHLVWNSDKKELHKSILISSGFIGYDKAPIFGSEKITLDINVNVFLPENFQKNGNDFALIKLPDNTLYKLSSENENNFPFRLMPFSEDDLDQKGFNVTGFTGWKSNNSKKPRGRLYNARAKYIKLLDNGEVKYRASSVRAGNSGSPIWIKKGESYCIIGIHRRGDSAIPELFGKRHGVAWTEEKIDLITGWMNQ